MMRTPTAVMIQEGRFLSRQVDVANPHEVNSFQRLRYDYFVQQRKWVCEDLAHPERERDCYDSHAEHLAVFEDDQVVAYLRALEWRSECGFMLEREFQCLLPPDFALHLSHCGAVELSRLVIAPQTRLSLREGRNVAELLFKLLYKLSLQRGWQHLYIVVEAAWLPLFQRRFGFPFHPLGPLHVFPDGTRTVAAYANIAELETVLAKYDPDKLAWYQQPS